MNLQRPPRWYGMSVGMLVVRPRLTVRAVFQPASEFQRPVLNRNRMSKRNYLAKKASLGDLVRSTRTRAV